MSGYMSEQQIDHILKLLKRAKRAAKDGRINVEVEQMRDVTEVIGAHSWKEFVPGGVVRVKLSLEWTEAIGKRST
jgi:hypothetical protein